MDKFSHEKLWWCAAIKGRVKYKVEKFILKMKTKSKILRGRIKTRLIDVEQEGTQKLSAKFPKTL